MAPTAYFIFCKEKREDEKQKLLAAGNVKVSVTSIAQALGERWKLLTDEERAAYKLQAQDLAKAQAAELGAAANDDKTHEEAGDAGPHRPDAVPASWVRKIVSADEEVGRCSADAAQALAAAADMFIALLSRKASFTAARAKRRTIKLDDVESTVRGDRRLAAAGLKDVCAFVAEQAAQQQEQQQQEQQQEEEQEQQGGEDVEDGGSKGRAHKTPKGDAGKRPKLAINRIERFFIAS